ncbi:unnamed protein product [Hymenolepis diminuta]|uniref:Epithelial membrane protein 2 n=1 Tax=Hymenolepis diminuta TaxID=6216 RepID=A0A0R3SWI1_HYMDI|nr:unnamed protein product [Hymenolepis diminuta]VUZ49233.1 unnamed protein product [Hymenolepis diminuta]
MIFSNTKYVLATFAIILFTCLAVSIDVSVCGSIFSTGCQNISLLYVQMTGLMATALAIFIVAAILSVMALMKSVKWFAILEFVVLVAGAVLMLAALCIYYRKNYYWAPLMGEIAMTLSFETAAFLLMEILT